MKTKSRLILLAVLSLGTVSLQAGVTTSPLSICGGADDDQFKLPPPPSLKLCGGADDDQVAPRPVGVLAPDFDALWNQVMGVPEHQGMTTDPLGIPPPQGTPAPAVQQLARMPVNEIIAILIGLRGVEADDTITGDAGDDNAGAGALRPVLTPQQAALLVDLARIVGGDGADFNNPATRDAIETLLIDHLVRRPEFILQICGGNGNDSLWGGGGTDEFMGVVRSWDTPMEVPLTSPVR